MSITPLKVCAFLWEAVWGKNLYNGKGSDELSPHACPISLRDLIELNLLSHCHAARQHVV